MLNLGFVVALALGFLALEVWGARTLPAERWQMLAAIPLSKAEDGSWRGLNLTFYGFFSATGIAFGMAILLLLLASVGLPVTFGISLALLIFLLCIPASRVIAGLVEGKQNTFTVAGAAFVATLVLPPLMLAIRVPAANFLHYDIPVLPIFAAAAIAYVLAEAIGRLACLSFGCCYGLPLRDAHPAIARLFHKHNLVLHGATKKAAYASGLAGQPLIPVQAMTSAIFALSGLSGIALFLTSHFRLAALLPIIASWGWRACSECLRADHRGSSRISAYQWMAIFSLIYLSAFLSLTPGNSVSAPNLTAAFGYMSSGWVIGVLQLLWVGLFVYYGRSRVTASTLNFHVVSERT